MPVFRVAATLSLLACLFTTARAQITIDPDAPKPIQRISGRLVIFGGGALPESVVKEFLRLAGGANARIVVLSEAEPSLDRWWDPGPTFVELLNAGSRDEADSKEFVEPLTRATGVWLDGDSSAELAKLYVGTRAETELKNVMKRRGVVGGMAIVTKVLLPGSIVQPHFKSKDRLLEALEAHPGLVGFGINERTALVVSRGRFLHVVGDGRVTAVVRSANGRPVRAEELRPRPFRRGRPHYTADLMAWSRSAQTRLQPLFPAKEPPVPEVKSGALVIVGGGVPRNVWERFIDLAGGKDAPIVCIPTAMGRNARSGGARTLRRMGCTNVTVLHTTDRAKADADEEFLKPLREARGVWFGGGRQWWLVDAYQNTTAHQLMLDVLKRGGVIGGSSAGASIQADYMVRGDPRPHGPTMIRAPGYETGLGFLVGVAIDQHFHRRNRMPEMTRLMKAYPQILGIGLDEMTAIVVKGTVAEVMGRGAVAFYDRRKPAKRGERDHELLRAGMQYDLKERRAIGGD